MWLPITNADNSRDVAPSMGSVTQSTDTGRVADLPGPRPTVSPPFVDMLGKVAGNLGSSRHPISRMASMHTRCPSSKHARTHLGMVAAALGRSSRSRMASAQSRCPPPPCPPTHAVPSPTQIPRDGGSKLGQQLQELHLVRSPTALAAAAAAEPSASSLAGSNDQLQLCEEDFEA